MRKLYKGCIIRIFYSGFSKRQMYKVNIKDSENFFDIDFKEGDILVNNDPISMDIEKIKDNLYHVIHGYKGFSVEIIAINPTKKEVQLKINGKTVILQIKDDMDLLLDKMGMSSASLNKVANIKSPMPGLVLDIKIEVGESVEKGTPLLILEAMKMENIIKSSGKGIVKAINIKQGQAVEKNEVLLEME